MKLRFLDFGEITADDGWAFEAAGVSVISNTNPDSLRRPYHMMGVLIEHPKEGPILYDVGPVPNFKELWPEPVQEVFGITLYEEENQLDKQLEKAGYAPKDISAIIISHLHLDHAGGLELFRGTDVPVYVHKEELKYAFYAIATKEDFGAYIPHYIDWSFNWKAVHESEIELFDGITVYQTTGHTPGTLSMMVNLKNSAPFIFPSDTMLHKENYFEEKPLGWLVRDMHAWWRDLRKLQNLEARYNANVLVPHDKGEFMKYAEKPFYD